MSKSSKSSKKHRSKAPRPDEVEPNSRVAPLPNDLAQMMPDVSRKDSFSAPTRETDRHMSRSETPRPGAERTNSSMVKRYNSVPQSPVSEASRDVFQAQHPGLGSRCDDREHAGLEYTVLSI